MKKMTICGLLLTLGIICTPFTVKANDNINNNELPTAGFTNFVNEINTFTYPTKINYVINGHNGMKTFMSYTTITDKTSNQYALQQKAYTDEMGFRKIDDRYCVAIGTAFNASVGQIFDATLQNGTVIKCIVGDIKSDKDTDISNIFTSQGCCLEFIVDTKKLDGIIKTLGDCSARCDEWDSSCWQFTTYNIDYLKKGELE